MDHMMMGGGMHMTFYVGNNATILFEPWKVSSWQGMLWSCVVILVVSFLYEGLKFLRQRLVNYARAQHLRANTRDRISAADDDELLLADSGWGRLSRRSTRILLHLIQTVLYMIQVTVGYMLMLVAMTYNAWLFISLVIGAGVGYLAFNFRGSILDEDLQGPCH